MNKNQFISYLILFLIVVSILLPVISWIISALGFDCKSLLSEEGWRWMFYTVPISFLNRWTLLCLSAIIGIGSIIRSGIFSTQKKKDINALYLVLIVLVFFTSVLLFSALHPHSPLLSVTGEIKSSPFIHGLPTIIIWCVIFLSAIYAVQTQHVKTIEDFSDLFTYGIRRFASVIVIAMLLSFIASCFSYIFNINI